MPDARTLPMQPCKRTEPHVGHTHVNEGPQGGCGLPEWCPGLTVTSVEALAEALGDWLDNGYDDTDDTGYQASQAVKRLIDSGEVRLAADVKAEASKQLVALSRWIDVGNAHRDPEAVLWGRVAKVSEEGGEAIAALIGATGQNPRKGITCDMSAVVDELLDVAVTALGAIEHINGHTGEALHRLDMKIARVAERAGIPDA